jgi:hypothetical protein
MNWLTASDHRARLSAAAARTQWLALSRGIRHAQTDLRGCWSYRRSGQKKVQVVNLRASSLMNDKIIAARKTPRFMAPIERRASFEWQENKTIGAALFVWCWWPTARLFSGANRIYAKRRVIAALGELKRGSGAEPRRRRWPINYAATRGVVTQG